MPSEQKQTPRHQRDTSGVHPHTVRCERSQLKKLLELIEDKPVDQISIRDVEAAIEARRTEGLSSNSLNPMGRMAKRFFKLQVNRHRRICIESKRVNPLPLTLLLERLRQSCLAVARASPLALLSGMIKSFCL